MPENNKTKRNDELNNKPGEKVSFFDINHPFNRFMSAFGTFVAANLLFLLGCIPIVTIGTSLSALNKVMLEFEKHGDVKVLNTFTRAYKENLLSGIIGLILGLGFLTAGATGIFFSIKASSMVLVVLGCMICAMITFGSLNFITFYFGIIANYENELVGHLKNGLIVGTAYIGYGVLIWMLWIIPLGLFYLFPVLLVYFGWFWVMVGFACLASVTVKIYRRVFRLIGNREVVDEF